MKTVSVIEMLGRHTYIKMNFELCGKIISFEYISRKFLIQSFPPEHQNSDLRARGIKQRDVASLAFKLSQTYLLTE